MKIYLLIVLISLNLFARHQPSPLPTLDYEVVDIDLRKCDEECLGRLLNQGEIFSFLAKYKGEFDGSLKESYEKFAKELHIISDTIKSDTTEVAMEQQIETPQGFRLKHKIAVLLPKKVVGRYAISSTSSMLSYLLSKNIDFELEIFDSVDESKDSIFSTIEQIKSSGFKYIVAVVTPNGADMLVDCASDLSIFIPTVNIKDAKRVDSNIIFGGIDYALQLEKLNKFANPKVAIFDDSSPISNRLFSLISQTQSPMYITHLGESDNLKNILTSKYSGSTIFLNTPIVKSSLLLSQFTYYSISPHSILSTQINYNPLLLTLTQEQDRDNLYIANSITYLEDVVEDVNRVMGNDIKYDWINYSVSIGLDYLISKIEPSYKRAFKEQIENNQVIYNIQIVKGSKNSFMVVE